MTTVFKIIGISIIATSGILFSMLIKGQLQKRSRMIDQLISSLVSLQNEITYGLNTLEESFLSLSRISGEMVCGFYKSCAVGLGSFRVARFSQIWRDNATKLFSNLIFCGPEKEIFINLGETLGAGDIDSQTRGLELALSRLKAVYKDTQSELKTKTKLFGGLSMIITAIIILIAI